MDWEEDVLTWLCKYGCVSNPRDEISKMVSVPRVHEEGCVF